MRPIKTLYFDINGTIAFRYECKPALANGAFEHAVRHAGFDRLVSMSNVQNTIKFLVEMGQQPDALAITFDMCWGAFRDFDWFRRVTTLVPDTEHRACHIDVTADWWYLDDLAEEYLRNDRLAELYATHAGHRVLAPPPDSNGEEILRWLKVYAAAAAGEQ